MGGWTNYDFLYEDVYTVEYRYNSKEYSIDGPQQETHPQCLTFQTSKSTLVEQEAKYLKIEGKPAAPDQSQASQ